MGAVSPDDIQFQGPLAGAPTPPAKKPGLLERVGKVLTPPNEVLEQGPPGLLRTGLAGADLAANVATGMGFGMPASLLAQGVMAPVEALRGNPEWQKASKEWGAKAAEAVTWKPVTPLGRWGADIINFPFAEAGQAAENNLGYYGSYGVNAAMAALGGRAIAKPFFAPEHAPVRTPVQEAAVDLQARGYPLSPSTTTKLGPLGKITEGMANKFPLLSAITQRYRGQVVRAFQGRLDELRGRVMSAADIAEFEGKAKEAFEEAFGKMKTDQIPMSSTMEYLNGLYEGNALTKPARGIVEGLRQKGGILSPAELAELNRQMTTLAGKSSDVKRTLWSDMLADIGGVEGGAEAAKAAAELRKGYAWMKKSQTVHKLLDAATDYATGGIAPQRFLDRWRSERAGIRRMDPKVAADLDALARDIEAAKPDLDRWNKYEKSGGAMQLLNTAAIGGAGYGTVLNPLTAAATGGAALGTMSMMRPTGLVNRMMTGAKRPTLKIGGLEPTGKDFEGGSELEFGNGSGTHPAGQGTSPSGSSLRRGAAIATGAALLPEEDREHLFPLAALTLGKKAGLTASRWWESMPVRKHIAEPLPIENAGMVNRTLRGMPAMERTRLIPITRAEADALEGAMLQVKPGSFDEKPVVYAPTRPAHAATGVEGLYLKNLPLAERFATPAQKKVYDAIMADATRRALAEPAPRKTLPEPQPLSLLRGEAEKVFESKGRYDTIQEVSPNKGLGQPTETRPAAKPEGGRNEQYAAIQTRLDEEHQYPKRLTDLYELGKKEAVQAQKRGVDSWKAWARHSIDSGRWNWENPPFDPESALESTFIKAGFYGTEMPKRTVGWRYGEPPKGGRSGNYADQRFENGVSVFETAIDHPKEVAGMPSEVNQLFFSDRPKVWVEGYQNPVNRGSDGEPLLVDVKKIDNPLPNPSRSPGHGEHPGRRPTLDFNKRGPR